MLIRGIHVKSGIHNLLQSPDIGENSDEDPLNFRILGQIPYKKNAITSEPVTKHITLIDKNVDQYLNLRIKIR